MKANRTLASDLLDNAESFRGEFFERFRLRTAPQPLRLSPKIVKSYLFPTLYGDVTCAQAIFLCDYGKAKALLPHPRMHPVRMTRGRAIVAFACYEYKRVLGVAPYNEIAMTIPVMVDPRVNLPVLPMLVPIFKEFGFYVFSMPVTSLENQIRGVNLWGLPKVVQEIDIRRDGDDCVTVALDEEQGEPYLEVRVPTKGKPTELDVRSHLYTRLGDELKQSETCFTAIFRVNKHPEVLLKRGVKAARPHLKILGGSALAATLRSLQIEEQPLETRYAEGMASSFDLPRADFRPTFHFRDGEAGEGERFPLASDARGRAGNGRKDMKKRARDDLKIVVYGSGVIGSTIGGWLAPHHEKLWMLDQAEVVRRLRDTGLSLYHQGEKDRLQTVRPRFITRLGEVPDPDVILLAVKNYHLETAAQAIRDEVGDRPIVVGIQNGLENQRILPRYFSKVVYCVVSYNAWMDSPGVVGYQKHGPLVLGTVGERLGDETHDIARILDLGVPTVVTDHIEDAAHSKVVINLANSLTTLIGHTQREISDRALFQRLLSGLAWEGVQVVRAAGFHECRLGGMPSWKLIWAAAHLPQTITRPLFEKNVRKLVLSSMAQDVLQRRSSQNELDSINGYILTLAEKHNIPAPINRAVYDLCKREFARKDFAPLDVKEVWAAVAAKQP